jgi:magnesium-transporting ATPase (P-type)
VVAAAVAAGLGERLRGPRLAESPFDPIRAFHAVRVPGRVCVKGAPEALLPSCVRVRAEAVGEAQPLDAVGRAALAERAQTLAERGLRVLLVAEGPEEAPLETVRDLTALGFIGISDPLRPDVPAAVRRCHEAGIRVLMITGDHPATAETIAREAGLLNGVGGLVTADALAELPPDELDAELDEVTVIARATPLDKLRVIESLQRQGHTVAMTGDGVNDAPALRLADVGIAMGKGGTEVARQTADMVLRDDDFTTLVEALVEGRSFWHNIRRAVGLLVGGNLGELGLVVGASVLGLAAPLTARQILVVNMISDVLPGLAVALQQPEHRKLADLAREGASALDRPLWNEVARRGVFTGAPSLAAYLAALTLGGLPQARAVAFASVVGSQLVQTLDMGWSAGKLTAPVLGAVASSAGLMGLALGLPAARGFLGLAFPTPISWALIGGATLAAFALSHLASAPRLPSAPHLLALPAAGQTTPAPAAR